MPHVDGPVSVTVTVVVVTVLVVVEVEVVVVVNVDVEVVLVVLVGACTTDQLSEIEFVNVPAVPEVNPKHVYVEVSVTRYTFVHVNDCAHCVKQLHRAVDKVANAFKY